MSLQHASLIKGKGVIRLLKLEGKAVHAGKGAREGAEEGKMMKRGGRGVKKWGRGGFGAAETEGGAAEEFGTEVTAGRDWCRLALEEADFINAPPHIEEVAP